tara:strand:+ start:1217 stop:1900 length:684 start_codon:yes stop_codon:yes gene_type:complete
MKKISIVIPALNEEQAIGRVISAIPVKDFKKLGLQTEILVIDNGSTDRTKTIAEQNGAKVIIQPDRGYGNAYRIGFANASGDIIATGDADLTYPMQDLPKMVKKLIDQNIDFMTTNRFAKMQQKAMSKRNRFGNQVLTFFTNMLFRVKIQDSQSGMWIFKKKVLGHLSLKSPGMPFSQELKIEAMSNGFKSVEEPITYSERVGEVKLNAFKDGFGNLFHLFKKRVMG